MGWIQEHLRQRAQNSSSKQAATEENFTAAACQRWQELGDELRADVAEFNGHQSGAEFTEESENRFRVSNSKSGLELTLSADFDNRNVRYSYAALNDRTAGVPEGGMLSMRQARSGSVEFYTADERLTSEEARQVLLEPMLFPRQATR